MLKAEVGICLFVLLIVTSGNSSPWVANTLAFISGMGLISIPELIKKKISIRDFCVRMIQVLCLVLGGYVAWQDIGWKSGFIWYIWAVTLFSDFIIFLIMKHGKKWLEKRANDISNDNE